MLIIITMLAFMGALLFVLTGVSGKITFQTNQIYLEAVRQNLVSSGITWARHNGAKGAETIELDTAGINARNARLSATPEKHGQVTIIASCSWGGQELKTNEKYYISARGK